MSRKIVRPLKGSRTSMSIALVVIVTMAALACLNVTSSGEVSSAVRSATAPHSFDLDGNGIDDAIDRGEVLPPLWTFVHLEGPGQVEKARASLGAIALEVEEPYTLVPAISVLFGDMGSMERASVEEGVEVIEVQRAPLPFLNTSVPGVRASPSELYSPDTAWEIGHTGQGRTIAIMDSGVDNEHPTFEGAFVAGVDLTVPDTPLTPRDGSYDPDDRAGHGTAVASVALGRGDSRGFKAGVAPSAGLIDVRVTGAFSLDITPNRNNIILGLEWCAANRLTEWGDGMYTGIDVISISLSIGAIDGAVAEAVNNTVMAGIPVVIAAGNSGSSYSDQSDTSWPDLAMVASGIDHQGTVDRSDDVFWDGSTYGPRTDDGDANTFEELKPDVSAPAEQIEFASFSRTSPITPADGWSFGSGTSFSAPFVAGVVAMMLEARPDLAPSSGSYPLRKVLHSGSEPRGSPMDPALSDIFDVHYGFGMLDAYGAVTEASGYSSANNRPEIRSFEVVPDVTTPGSVCSVRAVAVDIDEEPLEYVLTAEAGTISGEPPLWEWTAPDTVGTYVLSLEVRDPSGSSDERNTHVTVEEGAANTAPIITAFTADPEIVAVGEGSTLTVAAFDQEGDVLTYSYGTVTGDIEGTGSTVTYIASAEPGTDTVTVTVTDPQGAYDSRSLSIRTMASTINSPPVIVLAILHPNILTGNLSTTDLTLTVSVDDPDGLGDIDIVLVDLSEIGGGDEVYLRDDGKEGDPTASDGEYNLIFKVPAWLENGEYNIPVEVIDSQGARVVSPVIITIDVPASGDVTEGRSNSMDYILFFGGIVVVLLIAGSAVAFVIWRGRKKREEQEAPPLEVRFTARPLQ